eukprot:1112238-Rhodomonas_salina.2
MSGTDIRYAATRSSLCTPLRKSLRYYLPTPGADLGSAATSLRACDAMSGTERGCTAISLRTRCAMSGSDVAYDATRRGRKRWRRHVRRRRRRSVPLRAPYAMSGTHIAKPSISLRARYAMSGTQVAHVTMLSGTEIEKAVSCAEIPYAAILSLSLIHI